MKQLLKQGWLYRLITRQRTRKARAWLRYANLYPNEIHEIADDYHYSIARDYRGVLQVINLEECIRYVATSSLQGAFVETGVFTGGASAYALRSMLRNDRGARRSYWGFDSFEGMPSPTEADGERAKKWMAAERADGALTPSAVNLSDYDRTLDYLRGTGYPTNQIHLVKGWFQNTVVANRDAIGQIAILRLDGDFYESTKVVIEGLYDNVVSGGVIIVDDYGSFEGCRKAIDEFLAARGLNHFIHYVENGVRFFIKS